MLTEVVKTRKPELVVTLNELNCSCLPYNKHFNNRAYSVRMEKS